MASEASSDGLSSGVLLHAGDRVDAPGWDRLAQLRDSGQVAWLDLERPSVDQLQRLATMFGLHDEMVRDSASFDQRTRLADYDGYLLVVMYAVAADQESLVEVHLYVTPHVVISIRQEPCTVLGELQSHADRAVKVTTTVAALLSRILSTLVSTFSEALEHVDDDLTELEGRILDDPLSQEQLTQLLALRRRVNRFRRSVDPARDLVGAGRFVMIDALEDMSADARRHLRDLTVDLAHVGDQLEGERDRLSAVMDVYMNQVNNRQNDIMRQLAAVSTLFLPLTFLTGYFGMNFPEMIRGVESPTAFLLLGIALPVLMVVASLALMKRRRWW